MNGAITIISSQRYLDKETVETKKAALAADVVEIPCSYVGEIDGVEYAIVIDGHHTMAAARELGIVVVFDVSADSEELTGEELLEARYIDSVYYDIVTGVDVW